MSGFTWNASDYAQNSTAQKSWAAELLGKLRVQPAERVLDLGCGDGRITAEIAALVPQCNAVGVDYSGDMVAHARQSYGSIGNLQFAQADARALPFFESFEAIFSNAVLHWVKDHRAVLAAIRRSLCPGGRALLQMGGRGNAAAIVAVADEVRQSAAWRPYFTDFVFTYSFYGPEDYAEWLPAAGLQPVRVELIPKDMSHSGPESMAGWARTTWQPYTQILPADKRDAFVSAVLAQYLEQYPPDADGTTHVEMVRLEVEAIRPA